ncbi:choice-of-anchor P family protein [Streptomyces sp. T-3]|nr:choice-of-anchor P family protein [Streptomyces sp. T-3]
MAHPRPFAAAGLAAGVIATASALLLQGTPAHAATDFPTPSPSPSPATDTPAVGWPMPWPNMPRPSATAPGVGTPTPTPPIGMPTPKPSVSAAPVPVGGVSGSAASVRVDLMAVGWQGPALALGACSYPKKQEFSLPLLPIGDLGGVLGLAATCSYDAKTKTLTNRGGFASAYVKIPGLPIEADVLEASCSVKEGEKPKAHIGITGIKIGNLKLDPLDLASKETRFPIPGIGDLIVNEQIREGNKLTVRAFHFAPGEAYSASKLLKGDLVFGEAVCQG